MNPGFLARHPALCLGVLSFLLAAALFSGAGMVLDDGIFLERHLPTLETWREAIFVPPAFREWFGPLHRPFSLLTLQLDRAVWGNRIWGFHLTQALWYGLTVAGFTALAGTLLGALAAGLGEARRLRAAWIAGGLFALHPTHVDSAAWIATRHDVVFAALLCYGLCFGLRSLLAAWPRARWGWALAAGLAGLLSMQAKEAGYAWLPLLAVAALLRPAGAAPRAWGPALLCGAVAVLGSLVLRMQVEVGAFGTAWHPEWMERWLTATGWALKATVWPIDPALFHEAGPGAEGAPEWAGLTLLVAGLWAWWGIAALRRGNRLPLFGLLFAGITLAPTWTVAVRVLMTTVVADRYLLLPVGGAILAAAPLLAAPRVLSRSGTAVLLLFEASFFGRYALEWGGIPRKLSEHMIQHAPLNVAAREAAVVRVLRAGDLSGARTLYDAQPPAIERPGQEGNLRYLYALILYQSRAYPEAAQAALAAVSRKPQDLRRKETLGIILYDWFVWEASAPETPRQVWERVADARTLFQEVVAGNERAFRSWYHLGLCELALTQVAETEAEAGQHRAEGIRALEQAARYGAGTGIGDLAGAKLALLESG